MRRVTDLLLLAVFLAGVAHVAVLPPFEGYDETAHFSYIQQLADTGRIPVYGLDRLAADVDAYSGPMPSPAGQPFREYLRTDSAHAASTQGPTRYAAGAEFNWQAQHPPLFYLILAPAYRALSSLRWRWHLFGLRLTSWTIAFAGFAWGALQTQRLLRARGLAGWRLLVPAAWPFLFPEFLPEFARMTNDSLCILLFAAVWWLVQRWLQRGASPRRALAMGLLLGAGLLTKAFFVPVTLGITLLLLLATPRRRWSLVGLVPVVGLVVGGIWYLRNLRSTGSFIGAANLIDLDQRGGLLQGLRAHFSIIEYLRGLGGIISSFCWAGTWSFAVPSRLLLLPVAALAVVPAILYVIRVGRRDTRACAPALLVTPVVAGLMYHSLATLAATGVGNVTPGWYLHIFAAPLSMILVLGWPGDRLASVLCAYAFVLSAALACMQVAFFSGCLPRAGLAKVWLPAADCLIDVQALDALALPAVGLPALFAACASLLLAGTLLLRSARFEVAGR